MKDLIQQAAEEFADKNFNKDESAVISTANHFAMITRYGKYVTHFLSYAKENGYELLRVEGTEELQKEFDESEIDYVTYNYAIKYFALGAAKERERMKGVFEKASEDSWYYEPARNFWRKAIMDLWSKRPTTDELINLYQNKE